MLMDENVKEHLLRLIPKKVPILVQRHRECSKNFKAFWDTFPERFAEEFEAEPERTLEKYLSLSNEDCAWEKGDFMTRDRLLDNFIGREIARELKAELDKMEDIKPEEPEANVEQLLQENIRLKKERDMLEEQLLESREKLEEFKKEAENGGRGKELSGLRSRLEEKEEENRRLKDKCEDLEEKLKRCLQRREPKKLSRMAKIIKLGMKAKRFTPSYVSNQVGMKPHMVTDYLAELVEAGMLKKIQRGYYEVSCKLNEDSLEEEIARRLAGGKVDE
jgi:hypothetical protein